MHRHNVWIHSRTYLLTHTDRCITHKQIYTTYRHMHHTCTYIHTQTLMLIKTLIWTHGNLYAHTCKTYTHASHMHAHACIQPNIQIYMLRHVHIHVYTHMYSHMYEHNACTPVHYRHSHPHQNDTYLLID